MDFKIEGEKLLSLKASEVNHGGIFFFGGGGVGGLERAFL